MKDYILTTSIWTFKLRKSVEFADLLVVMDTNDTVTLEGYTETWLDSTIILACKEVKLLWYYEIDIPEEEEEDDL